MFNSGRKVTTFRAYTCAKIVVFCVFLIIFTLIRMFFAAGHKKKYAKNHFYLHISKNSSTFAADFRKNRCRGGGIGRHEGLKILWPVMAVRVQVPPAVPIKEKERCYPIG